MSKFLDGGGVSYLWTKIRSLISTETAEGVTQADLTAAIQKINYPSNETETYSYDFGKFKGTKTQAIPSSLFEYGKAKLFTLTISAQGTGVFDYGTGILILPSGGTYIRFYPHTEPEEDGVAQKTGGFEFLSGGSEVLRALGGDKKITATETFYLARVA